MDKKLKEECAKRKHKRLLSKNKQTNKRRERNRIINGRYYYEYPEYVIWYAMISRCSNKNNINYKNYGGRGITVCQRWVSSFFNFYIDMGCRPSEKLTLERIDNDGNYEPNNCKWATREEQSYNKRDSISIEYKGKLYNSKQISEMSNVRLSPQNVRNRISLGWDIHQIMNISLTSDVSGKSLEKIKQIINNLNKEDTENLKIYITKLCQKEKQK